MFSLAAGLGYVDLNFLGVPEIIATAVLHGASGVALIDPGPSTTLDNLKASLQRRNISVADVRQVLLTHIHLDHAGVTGTLVRENPAIEVFVHERGAPHLVDPTKLLASAERLYGDKLNYLWGEILPVPEANVRPLAGGEDVFGMRVAYTPGHASHHVCYFHEESGTAFVGDVAAVRIPPSDLVVPPTPPPDIDIETWLDSIAIVESWRPERLALTHFGAIEDPIEHLEIVRKRLREEADLAREFSEDDYERHHRAMVTENLSPEAAEELLQAVPPQYQWRGLNRYWNKREERDLSR